ncbi:hypothetical protein HD554DRAFT_1748722 [Boletus coccyginus]|nr:hypothetical protein HD554DRAFT_1748722 [Boletus coccyginus]
MKRSLVDGVVRPSENMFMSLDLIWMPALPEPLDRLALQRTSSVHAVWWLVEWARHAFIFIIIIYAVSRVIWTVLDTSWYVHRASRLVLCTCVTSRTRSSRPCDLSTRSRRSSHPLPFDEGCGFPNRLAVFWVHHHLQSTCPDPSRSRPPRPPDWLQSRCCHVLTVFLCRQLGASCTLRGHVYCVVWIVYDTMRPSIVSGIDRQSMHSLLLEQLADRHRYLWGLG